MQENKKNIAPLILVLVLIIAGGIFLYVKTSSPGQQVTIAPLKEFNGQIKNVDSKQLVIYSGSATTTLSFNEYTIFQHIVITITPEQRVSKEPFVPQTELKNGSVLDLKNGMGVTLKADNNLFVKQITYTSYDK